MSTGKKLNISIEKLAEIADALNKNNKANKERSKEEKICTDKFIKKFNITRKNFSATIKETKIKYNRSTFLYDIPKEYLQSNEKVIHSNTQVILNKIDNHPQENLALNKKISQAVTTIIKNSYPEIEEIKDMVSWYKSHIVKENIIEIPEININTPKLTGEVVSKSFKTYKKVINKFVHFCKERKETQKDLLALALVEFMEKYKK